MFQKDSKVVTRMAPSPTGHLHIGTARTALYNFLYAKNKKGNFILRSEDTDRERSTKAFEEEICDGLSWLGISWDAYFRQSERGDVYTPYLEKIIAAKHAYVSKEESRAEPGKQVEVVRLRNPNKTITFDDEVRGEVTFDTTELGDFVIARSMQEPLYHFAVVVDDHDMGVTHVIRGEDHISNTQRQILIQEAIGADRPIYAHLPLMLAPDRSKLSKRHGAVALYEFQQEGFLPEALVNYLALLGWNPGTDKELFTLDELVAEFDLSGVQSGGAMFSMEKLRWFNKEHLKKQSVEEHTQMILERLPERVTSLPQYSEERVARATSTIIERISVAGDVAKEAEAGEYDFYFAAPSIDLDMLKWKKDTSVRDALPRLQHVAEIISTMAETSSAEDIKDRLWKYAEEVGKGEVLWPLRVALTGKERSPDPFTVMHVIGSGEAYKRVQIACDTILKA